MTKIKISFQEMKDWFTMAYIIIIVFIHTQHTIFSILCTGSGIQWMLILILCTHTIQSLICASPITTHWQCHSRHEVSVERHHGLYAVPYFWFSMFELLNATISRMTCHLLWDFTAHIPHSPYTSVEFLLFRFSFLISIDMNFGYYVWEFHDYSSNFVIW